MKKTTAFLLTSTYSLAFVSNSFGMLTKPSFHITKIRYFQIHTTSNTNPGDCPPCAQDCHCNKKEMLRRIIQQNQENNELLHAILKQNHLLSNMRWKNYPRDINLWNDSQNLYDLYLTLEKKDNIKVDRE